MLLRIAQALNPDELQSRKVTAEDVRRALAEQNVELPGGKVTAGPGEQNARWFWAVIVDLMAGVMCFWGVSGLLMWWQLKATRKLGTVILVLSAIVATAIAARGTCLVVLDNFEQIVPLAEQTLGRWLEHPPPRSG